jgi:ABC-type phosphate/phosphonate transport system substrate-binding protein
MKPGFIEKYQRSNSIDMQHKGKQRTPIFTSWGYSWTAGFCFLCLIAFPGVSKPYGHSRTSYPKVFHFGVLGLLSGVNQKDAQAAIELNLMRDNRNEFPDLKVHVEIIPDVSSAVRLFGRRRLHGIVLTSSDYLALKEQTSMVTPLFISSPQEKLLEAYVLLVSNSVASIDHLSTLGRRRLVMESSGETNIGQLWLDTVLWEHGKRESKSFFSSIRKEIKAARIVLPVFFGQSEACLVPESVFRTMTDLNPQIGQKLKVLKRSPGFVHSVMCSAENLDPELVAAIKRNAANMPHSVEGQQLMMIFQYQNHCLFDPDYLKATERIYQIHKEQSVKRWSRSAKR